MKNRQPNNILVLSDAIVPTGFARVIYEIMSPLRDEFNISQMGVNYQGGEHSWPWKIYQANENGDDFGFDRLKDLLSLVQPDLIFMLGDDVVLTHWMNIINTWPGRNNTRVIVYCPVDSHPIMPEVITALSSVDRLFTFTEFGRRCFLEGFCNSGHMCVEVVPHGIETVDFHPLNNDIQYHLSPEGRYEAKRSLAGGDDRLDDTFIVLNANRNQPRKRYDITLRGFAQFAAGKPASVMLYCHCGIKEIGWNLVDLAKREGITDRLILSTNKPGTPFLSKGKLNEVYNACDVGINTSSSEGWGLVSFEHAAAGSAQVIPDHTGVTELWKGYAEMLSPSVSITYQEKLSEQYIISPGAVAESLERLYRDRNYLHEMSLAAYKNATRPEYNWQTIAFKWRDVFREELARLSCKPI